MSLILEALRKSEAERRRGQAPQLFDSPVTAPPAATKRSLQAVWWAIPVVLSAVLLASWHYSATSGSAGDPVGSDDAAGMSEAAQAAPPAPRTSQPSQDAEARPAGLVDAPRSVAASTDPAVVVSRSEPASAAPMQSAAATTPAETAHARSDAASIEHAPRAEDISTRVSRQPPAPAPQIASTSAPRPAPSSAANAPRPSSEPAPSPAASTSAPPTRIPSNATAALPTQPLQGTKAEPLRLADLTPAERRSLPPLKMSMHMWSADATQRFVILDGARVGEGDRVGEAVIDEITPDGAVLAWTGRRVKVPVH